MTFLVEPGTGICTANVLTDPADPKSPKARCCKVPAVWRVRPTHHLNAEPQHRACPKHLNILLTDLREGWN